MESVTEVLIRSRGNPSAANELFSLLNDEWIAYGATRPRSAVGDGGP